MSKKKKQMAHLEFTCSDEKAAALLQASRLFDEGVKPSGWISVKYRLPEDDENLRFYDDGQLCFTSVLVHDKERGTAIANRLVIRPSNIPGLNELATEGWVWSRPYEPTHWMPLPEPPKEDAHESDHL